MGDVELEQSPNLLSTAGMKQMYMEVPVLGDDEFERKYRFNSDLHLPQLTQRLFIAHSIYALSIT